MPQNNGTDALLTVAGIAIPQVAAASLPTPVAGAEGQLVWDTTNHVFRVSNGSAWSSPVSCVNAADFPDLQTAMSAVTPGGRLYIPGDMTVPSGGLIIDRAVEIFGDARGSESVQKAILRPFAGDSANQPVLVIAKGDSNYPAVGGIHIHDLEIIGGATAFRANSHGIRADMSAAQKLEGLNIARVVVKGMGDDGVYVNGIDGGASAVIQFTLKDCYLTFNRGRGLYVHGTTIVTTSGNYFSQNWFSGAKFDQCGFNSFGDYFEMNCKDGGCDATYDSQLRVRICNPFTLLGATFQSFNTATQTTNFRGLTVEASTGVIMGCFFSNGAENPGTASQRGIYLDYNSANSPHRVFLGPNYFTNCATAIESHSSNVGCTIMPQSKGTGANAMMKNAGLALDQIPTASLPTLVAAAKGQLAYDSTLNKLTFWDGGAWRVVTST